MKGKCGYDGSSAHCAACNGLIHNPLCKAKMNPKKDCCPKRHKALHDSGQITGINDSAVIMWEENDQELLEKNTWFPNK